MSDESDPIGTLLAVAAAALVQAGVEFALIGGCARNLYAEPRGTRDVDVAVTSGPSSYLRVTTAFLAHGFKPGSTVKGDDNDAEPDLAHFRDDAGGRIDVLFAKTAFEREALSRRTGMLRVSGRPFPVVTPEDLIVYKLIAGRPQDIVDVEEVARALLDAGQELDWPYVERWCREWEVLDRLQRVQAAIATLE